MRPNIQRHLLFAIAAIPVGAVSGYICAFIVDSIACLFSLHFHSHKPYEVGVVFHYAAICWAPIGAVLGAVMLPIAYLALLRHVTFEQAPRVVGWLFCGVLGAGLLASPLSEVHAFLAVFPGFLAGLIYGYIKTAPRPKTART